ncbi:hypothetical protein BGX21_004838, partial [Mortierella sp. AD011]
EVEEVIDETKAQEIISHQDREIEEKSTTVTETTTTTTEEVGITEEGEVCRPADSKGSLFGRLVSSTKGAAGAVGGAVGDVSSAVAHGAIGDVGAVGAATSGVASVVVHGAESAARGVGHIAESVVIGTGAVAVGGDLIAVGAVIDVAATAGVKTGDAIVENPVDEGEPAQVITAATTGTGAAPDNPSKDSPDRPRYRGRPQKSNIFTYNIKRQNTDEMDYVSGSGYRQHRDDYESDDGDGYMQSRTRRRLAAKARAKYLDDD